MKKLLLFAVVAGALLAQSCTQQPLDDDTQLVDKTKIERPGDQGDD